MTDEEASSGGPGMPGRDIQGELLLRWAVRITAYTTFAAAAAYLSLHLWLNPGPWFGLSAIAVQSTLLKAAHSLFPRVANTVAGRWIRDNLTHGGEFPEPYSSETEREDTQSLWWLGSVTAAVFAVLPVLVVLPLLETNTAIIQTAIPLVFAAMPLTIAIMGPLQGKTRNVDGFQMPWPPEFTMFLLATAALPIISLASLV